MPAKPQPPHRPLEPPRNTARQREAGNAARQETRRLLLEAAAEEFAARGYTAATVNRIAAGAGVTVPTLYLAWGSKRALLRGYMEAALAGGSTADYGAQLARALTEIGRRAAGDPVQVVEAVARLFCDSARRAALGWQLYRDAAASEPEIAQDWRALQLLRRETFRRIISLLPPGSLRPGLSAAAAADTAWVLASPESYDLMVRIAGHSISDFDDWVKDALTAALLVPGAAEAGRPAPRRAPPR